MPKTSANESYDKTKHELSGLEAPGLGQCFKEGFKVILVNIPFKPRTLSRCRMA
jgi:hypothetical protein